MKLIIVTGLAGCGKTTYAKSLNIPYISFDSLFNYGSRTFNHAALKNRVSKMSQPDVVMDGIIFKFDPNLAQTLKSVAPRSIEVVVLYTTLEHLYECQRSTETRRKSKEREGLTKEEDFTKNREVFLKEVYHYVNSLKVNARYIFRLGGKYEERDSEHFLKTIGGSSESS